VFDSFARKLSKLVRFQEDMIENEVKILRQISHPNIMSLIAEQDTKTMLYLVCEYVKGDYLIFLQNRNFI
jgi:serine/threonine protein kinase